MKNRILFIPSLLLAVISCSRGIVPEAGVRMSFSVMAEQSVKTQLAGGKDIVWNRGDRISVFDSARKNCLFSTDEDGAAVTFTGVASPSDVYYAVYPFSAENAISAEGIISTAMPSVQLARRPGFGQDANLAVAQSVNEAFSMRNIGGYLSFSFAGCGSVSSICVSAAAGEKLSGRIMIPESGIATAEGVIPLRHEGDSEVLLVPSEGNSAIEEGSYQVVILPSDIAEGLEFAFTATDGSKEKTITYLMPRSLSVERNTVCEFTSTIVLPPLDDPAWKDQSARVISVSTDMESGTFDKIELKASLEGSSELPDTYQAGFEYRRDIPETKSSAGEDFSEGDSFALSDDNGRAWRNMDAVIDDNLCFTASQAPGMLASRAYEIRPWARVGSHGQKVYGPVVKGVCTRSGSVLFDTVWKSDYVQSWSEQGFVAGQSFVRDGLTSVISSGGSLVSGDKACLKGNYKVYFTAAEAGDGVLEFRARTYSTGNKKTFTVTQQGSRNETLLTVEVYTDTYENYRVEAHVEAGDVITIAATGSNNHYLYCGDTYSISWSN